MIPKTIHYCWFGGNPLPKSALRCIRSWEKHFPGWEIRRWDESNFDVNAIPYTRDAYAARKYAFVSDYARFKILHEHGGIYFDTDVEVIRPMDLIIARGAFMGIETSDGQVNPGLGIGAEAGHAFYAAILRYYGRLQFTLHDEAGRIPTVVQHTTRLLKEAGYHPSDTYAEIAGIHIYPSGVFNPLDDYTGRLNVTPVTVSIHHYAKTWIDGYGPLRRRMAHLWHRFKGRRR